MDVNIKNFKLLQVTNYPKFTLKVFIQRKANEATFAFMLNDSLLGTAIYNLEKRELKTSDGKKFNILRFINYTDFLCKTAEEFVIFYTCNGAVIGYDVYPQGDGVYYFEVCPVYYA